MVIEDRLVRDLPVKSSIDLDDLMLIEDIDGTKLGYIRSIRSSRSILDLTGKSLTSLSSITIIFTSFNNIYSFHQ